MGGAKAKDVTWVPKHFDSRTTTNLELRCEALRDFPKILRILNPVLFFLLSPLWDTLGPLRRSAPGARCLGSKEPGPVCSKRGHGAAFLTPRKKLVDAADPVSSWNELPAPIEFAQNETRLKDWVSIHLITKHGCVCNLITSYHRKTRTLNAKSTRWCSDIKTSWSILIRHAGNSSSCLWLCPSCEPSCKSL